VGLLKLGNGQMRVNLRGLKTGMAEHDLDVPHVATVGQQPRGKGMAEEMATARLEDAGPHDHLAHDLGQVTFRVARGPVGEE